MKATDISVEYSTIDGTPVKAVNRASFSLEHGEVLGIAGESGCGKSTLAAALSGNSAGNMTITGGTVSLDDTSTIDLAETQGIPRNLRGSTISLLPQRALNSLNPTARIGDFAFDVLRSHDRKVTRRQALEKTGDRLDQLGLPRRVLESYPHQLSGGMRQRVVTVISTLLDPQILIADEPTSALDVSSQKALVLMLQKMLQEGMLSRAIFITHDLALLSNIASKIAIMYAGEIVEQNTTAEIVHRPGHPYTQALLASTLEPDPRIRSRRILGLTGQSPDMRRPPSGCRFHPRCPYAMPTCVPNHPPAFTTGSGFAHCWLLDPELDPEQRAMAGERAEVVLK
jgi:peptide/nickel transport system ATP-binding protein